MKKDQKKTEKPINIGASPKAHEKMRQEAFKEKRSMREQLNFINNLPLNS